MNHRLLFLLAASAFLLPGEASAQLSSRYRYERTVVGPEGGVSVEQQSSRAVAGPFGAATRVSRSGSYVASSGATLEYSHRYGSVVGPLGGVRGSSSYVHAESADRGLTYSRLSSSLAVGPDGGVAYGRTTAAVGPFGAADDLLSEMPAELASELSYERTVVGPSGGVSVEEQSSRAVAGPFGAATRVSRSGSYVASSGATLEYSHRYGSVVGPLGGVRGSSSYVHAESADRGLTYSRLSSNLAVGPGGVAYGQTTAAVGPFGAAGYRRSAVIVRP
jgi:hypothetical protein